MSDFLFQQSKCRKSPNSMSDETQVDGLLEQIRHRLDGYDLSEGIMKKELSETKRRQLYNHSIPLAQASGMNLDDYRLCQQIVHEVQDNNRRLPAEIRRVVGGNTSPRSIALQGNTVRRPILLEGNTLRRPTLREGNTLTTSLSMEDNTSPISISGERRSMLLDGNSLLRSILLESNTLTNSMLIEDNASPRSILLGRNITSPRSILHESNTFANSMLENKDDYKCYEQISKPVECNKLSQQIVPSYQLSQPMNLQLGMYKLCEQILHQMQDNKVLLATALQLGVYKLCDSILQQLSGSRSPLLIQKQHPQVMKEQLMDLKSSEQTALCSKSSDVFRTTMQKRKDSTSFEQTLKQIEDYQFSNPTLEQLDYFIPTTRQALDFNLSESKTLQLENDALREPSQQQLDDDDYTLYGRTLHQLEAYKQSHPSSSRQDRSLLLHPSRQDRSSLPHPSRQDRSLLPHPSRQDRSLLPHPSRQDCSLLPNPILQQLMDIKSTLQELKEEDF